MTETPPTTSDFSDGVVLPARVNWPMRAYVQLAILLGGLGILVALIAYAATPRQYTSTSAVVASSDAGRPVSGQLGALSGVLGLSTEGQENPQYISSVLISRDVLAAVAKRRVQPPGRPDSVPLATILLGAPAVTPVDLARARDMLRGSVTTDVEARTGVISISVTLRSAALAQTVNSLLIQQADSINQAMRRNQASRRRTFVERRLDVAKGQLQDAEDAQRTFWQANSVRSAPALMLEDRRLDRVIAARQEVYTSLARDYEQSLQDEVRDIPSLSIFTEPDVPWRKSKPSGVFFVVAGAGTGALVATLLIFLIAMRSDGSRLPQSVGDVFRAFLPRRSTREAA